jgi:hypothetical protein
MLQTDGRVGALLITCPLTPTGHDLTHYGALTAECDDGFDLMLKRRGEALTKGWYQSQVAGIDRIEANIE